ncbi:hypothetical protein Tfer_2462 [Thermincola ferriacetica]|uniref:Uncharacterized protein n=1 Tax=Thermincola ferriacetica TaxID=281456 RepID=A0A0L6W0R7_9FIRM|nr:hypothetical protein Tfer_2462 [Thermincola ferriacetica]
MIVATFNLPEFFEITFVNIYKESMGIKRRPLNIPGIP